MPPKKKTIIVVKEIKAESRKKEIFVSRRAKATTDADDLEPSLKGNNSPQVNLFAQYRETFCKYLMFECRNQPAQKMESLLLEVFLGNQICLTT